MFKSRFECPKTPYAYFLLIHGKRLDDLEYEWGQLSKKEKERYKREHKEYLETRNEQLRLEKMREDESDGEVASGRGEPDAKRRRLCAADSGVVVVGGVGGDRLDGDSLAHVFCFLSCPKVLQLRLTNKHWDQVIMTSDYMWDQFLARDFYGALGEGKIVQVEDEPVIESDDDERDNEEEEEEEEEEQDEEQEEGVDEKDQEEEVKETSDDEENEDDEDDEDGEVDEELDDLDALEEVTEEVTGKRSIHSKVGAEEKQTGDKEEVKEDQDEKKKEEGGKLTDNAKLTIPSFLSLSMKAYSSLYGMIPSLLTVDPIKPGEKKQKGATDDEENEEDEDEEESDERGVSVLFDERVFYKLASFSGAMQVHKLALILSLLTVNDYVPAVLRDMVKIGLNDDHKLIPLSQFCYAVLTGREIELYPDEDSIPSEEELKLNNTNVTDVDEDELYNVTGRDVLDRVAALSPNIQDGFIPFVFYTFMKPTRKIGSVCDWTTDENEFVTRYDEETGRITVSKKRERIPVF